MADVVPEDVTCRNLRDRQVRREELGLCPLARTRGAHEDDTHYRNYSRRTIAHARATCSWRVA